MHKTAFNTTDQPVTVDAEGRMIGGQEWGSINTTADEAKALLEQGIIVIVDKPGDDADVNPEAAAAFDATDRLAELAALPADEVKDQAVEAGVADDASDVTKAEAVEKLGRSSAKERR